MELHPDNTLTHHVTALPQRISPSSIWECCFLETQYPHSRYNVRDEDARGFLSKTDAYGIDSSGRIESGYYDGPHKLIQEIKNTLGVSC